MSRDEFVTGLRTCVIYKATKPTSSIRQLKFPSPRMSHSPSDAPLPQRCPNWAAGANHFSDFCPLFPSFTVRPCREQTDVSELVFELSNSGDELSSPRPGVHRQISNS
ncbi:hypothetical protein BsWGS_26801 [Bradybaena similaris]